jgi:hypothetical protein
MVPASAGMFAGEKRDSAGPEWFLAAPRSEKLGAGEVLLREKAKRSGRKRNAQKKSDTLGEKTKRQGKSRGWRRRSAEGREKREKEFREQPSS